MPKLQPHPPQVFSAVKMNIFFLFLLLSYLEPVCCNSEEKYDLEDMKAMERNEITMQAARAPKAIGLGTKVGCIATDDPPVYHSSKSHHHEPCDEEGCIETELGMETGPLSGKFGMLPVDNGMFYNGSLSTTQAGKTCMKWSDLTQLSASLTIEVLNGGLEKNIGDHNYCRGNPGDTLGVYCFVTDSSPPTDKCEVRRCLKLTKGER